MPAQINRQRRDRFASERGVRDTHDRRRRRTPLAPLSSGETLAKANPAPSVPASQARPLRRWSVAELVARAAVRPPGGELAH